jgi:hypothetical protein
MYKEMDYKPVFDQLEQWGYRCWFSATSRKIRIRSKEQKEIMKKVVRTCMRRMHITKSDCLHPSVPKVVRITNCWEKEYNSYHGWVNGLCHNTKVPALNQIFGNLSQEMWRGAGGNCDGKVTQRSVVDNFVKTFVSSKGVDIVGKGVDPLDLPWSVTRLGLNTSNGGGGGGGVRAAVQLSPVVVKEETNEENDAAAAVTTTTTTTTTTGATTGAPLVAVAVEAPKPPKTPHHHHVLAGRPAENTEE